MTDRSTEEIQQAVRKKYAEVSRSVAGKCQYLTGKAGAAALGYDLSVLSDLPDDVFDTFCGVGNPVSERLGIALVNGDEERGDLWRHEPGLR